MHICCTNNEQIGCSAAALPISSDIIPRAARKRGAMPSAILCLSNPLPISRLLYPSPSLPQDRQAFYCRRGASSCLHGPNLTVCAYTTDTSNESARTQSNADGKPPRPMHHSPLLARLTERERKKSMPKKVYADEFEVNFEVYATNSMAGYEPPPPHPIGFDAAWEEYYDELVGDDYIDPKFKPKTSLIKFLEDLNKKMAEDDAKAGKPPRKMFPNRDLNLKYDEGPRFLKPRGQAARYYPAPPVMAPLDWVLEGGATPYVKLPPIIFPKRDEDGELIEEEQAKGGETAEEGASEMASVDSTVATPSLSTTPPLASSYKSSSERYEPILLKNRKPQVAADNQNTTEFAQSVNGTQPIKSVNQNPLVSEAPSYQSPPGPPVPPVPANPSPPMSSTLVNQIPPMQSVLAYQRSPMPSTPINQSVPMQTVPFNDDPPRPFAHVNHDPLLPVPQSPPGPAAPVKRDPSPSVVAANQYSPSAAADMQPVQPSNPESYQSMNKVPSEPYQPIKPVSTSASSSLGYNNVLYQPEAQAVPTPSPGPYQTTPSEVRVSPIMPLDKNIPPATKPYEQNTAMPTSSINSRESLSSLPTQPPQPNYVTDGLAASAQHPSSPTVPPVNVSRSPVSEVRTSVNEVTESKLGVDAGTSEFYNFKEGDIVLGVVVSGNELKLDVEIGAGRTAILPYKDLQTFPRADLESCFFELGASINASVVGRSLLLKDENESTPSGEFVEEGTVVVAEIVNRTLMDSKPILSCRILSRKISWNRVFQLMQVGEPLQFDVDQFNAGGLLGEIEGIRAFLPRSELLQRPESAALLKDFVGKVLLVAMVQADVNASNLIVSELKPWMHKNLTLGSVHDVTVTQVYPYGIQVEINNTRLRGFVHISNMSNEYVGTVNDHFQVGDKVRVMSIKGRNPQQISFSFAQLESERGLLLRDKERVYREADEMAMKYREGLSVEECVLFGPVTGATTSVEPEQLNIANMQWLHLVSERKAV